MGCRPWGSCRRRYLAARQWKLTNEVFREDRIDRHSQRGPVCAASLAGTHCGRVCLGPGIRVRRRRAPPAGGDGPRCHRGESAEGKVRPRHPDARHRHDRGGGRAQPSDLDPATRRQAIARIYEHIQLAGQVGSAVTIGLVRGRLGRGPDRASRRAAMAEGVGECCRLAAAEGVTVFLEPLNRYEADHLMTLDQGADLIRELRAPNLRLLADTFHMNIEEVDIAAELASPCRRPGPCALGGQQPRSPRPRTRGYEGDSAGPARDRLSGLSLFRGPAPAGPAPGCERWHSNGTGDSGVSHGEIITECLAFSGFPWQEESSHEASWAYRSR